jgi:hypothetical protein
MIIEMKSTRRYVKDTSPSTSPRKKRTLLEINNIKCDLVRLVKENSDFNSMTVSDIKRKLEETHGAIGNSTFHNIRIKCGLGRTLRESDNTYRIGISVGSKEFDDIAFSLTGENIRPSGSLESNFREYTRMDKDTIIENFFTDLVHIIKTLNV